MPSDTFRKLNLKDQGSVTILDPPRSLEPEISSLTGVTAVRKLGKSPVVWALAFVTKQDQVDAFATSTATLVEGDAVVWLAYPKQSSKKLTCEFNRDTGWESLGKEGFEPVRVVAIDEDWSALRFRRAEFIRTMKRDARHALSEVGKARAGGVAASHAVPPSEGDAWLATLPDDRRVELARMRDVIVKNLPRGYEEAVAGTMLAWQVPLTTFPDTYNKQPLWLAALTSQKSYMTLHLMPVYGDTGALKRLEEGFKARGKKLRMGKACLNVHKADDLALDVIGDLISGMPVDAWVKVTKAARRKP